MQVQAGSMSNSSAQQSFQHAHEVYCSSPDSLLAFVVASAQKNTFGNSANEGLPDSFLGKIERPRNKMQVAVMQ
jgi:hypothetical protein